MRYEDEILKAHHETVLNTCADCRVQFGTLADERMLYCLDCEKEGYKAHKLAYTAFDDCVKRIMSSSNLIKRSATTVLRLHIATKLDILDTDVYIPRFNTAQCKMVVDVCEKKA